MKIVFIETPSPWLVRQHAQFPLGPLYLATVLKNAGYDVRIFRPDKIEQLDEILDYDVIGFTGTTLEFPMVVKCVEYVKAAKSKASLWYGGPHASTLASQDICKNIFDTVCIGEGEGCICQMIEDFKNQELKPTYQATTPRAIDEIPIPDRRLIEGTHGGDIFAFNENYIGEGNENVITSRGCPFRCIFCGSNAMWGRNVRFRSVENVVKEIEYIIKTTGCKQIRFGDDNITSHKPRLRKLCKEFKRLGIIWRCSARATDINDEIAEIMYSGGCREISPGIESGDQRVLDYLRKDTTLVKLKAGVQSAQKAGIKVRGLFMIGTPGEREDTPELNRDFMKELNLDYMSMTTFVPLPGTPVFHHPEQYNCELLSKDFEEYNIYFWVAENGEKKERKLKMLLRNNFLTKEQQLDNIERMKGYYKETQKYNRG